MCLIATPNSLPYILLCGVRPSVGGGFGPLGLAFLSPFTRNRLTAYFVMPGVIEGHFDNLPDQRYVSVFVPQTALPNRKAIHGAACQDGKLQDKRLCQGLKYVV